MILVLIIYFVIFMILSFGTKKLSNKFFLFNIFALAMIFICFALSIFPAKTVDFPSKLKSFDLFRYYWQMDLLRSGSFNEIVSFVFEKIWFGFRIIEYLLSLLTNCNSLLVVVSIIINFLCFSYIFIKLNKMEENLFNRKDALLSIVCFLSIVNPLHLLSGIRNSMAVAIFSLGLFKIFFEHKNRTGFLLILLSISIHPMILIYVIILMMVRILRKLKLSKKIYMFLILLSLMVSPFSMKIIGFIGNLGILPQFISEKMIYYSLEATYYSYFNLIIELLQLLVLFLYIKNVKKFQKNYLLCFLFMTLVTNIFFIMNSTFFVRIKFVFAFTFPCLIYYSKKNNVKTKYNGLILFGLSFIIFIRYLIEFIGYFNV